MADPGTFDARRIGPADLVNEEVTPELLLCTAVVRCGLADGAGASILLGPSDRIGLAATDETFVEVAEMQFTSWEGPGPEVVEGGRAVVVDDLHAQRDRWPLTTPHARTTLMRALATLPLSSVHGVVGLFAVYRASPVPFTRTDLAHLQTVAATVGVLAGARFDEGDLALHAPPPALSLAVGMVAARLGVAPDDALAILRARAFALSISAPALARELASGAARVEDVLGLADER